MKKILTGILMLLLTGCILVGCGGSKAADGQVELKLGQIQSENDLWQKGAEKVKEEVEKDGNRRFRIDCRGARQF